MSWAFVTRDEVERVLGHGYFHEVTDETEDRVRLRSLRCLLFKPPSDALHLTSSATAAGDALRLQWSLTNCTEPSDCPASGRSLERTVGGITHSRRPHNWNTLGRLTSVRGSSVNRVKSCPLQ